ncbi:hypothetical protein MD588_15265 [Photobacterium sp. SDRW27]|uniref:hypothetical protein n=1 Tax=Photobacterium obscurum TaxID=2829490 RepID=UPI00224345F4|nr:hypothetical protein [Photobacterium obscurum]MCW8330168.1 hypothetical protein [Photobacterium obscurum]
MIRMYAQFAFNNPKLHFLNLCLLAMVIMVSTYQVLANEELVFSIGLLLPVVPFFVFAKASDYKRKYLHG